ncbi:hypothetical protein C7M84_017674 [Penaeus vannamei]|uniref:Uncharacterized protein n=1 Tax=Penaeus vannamei TaxID=6689 RepID=A0A3R7SK47_PENVA|nr:hypothetical protein C7M84_017674 [Penaeus vannamei]
MKCLGNRNYPLAGVLILGVVLYAVYFPSREVWTPLQVASDPSFVALVQSRDPPPALQAETTGSKSVFEETATDRGISPSSSPSSSAVGSPRPAKSQTSKACSLEVDLAPCSCSRTLTLEVPGACPETSDEALKRIKESLGQSTFTVYGQYPTEYHVALRRFLVPRVAEVYPGWVMRVYHDLSYSNEQQKEWLCNITCSHPHVDFCDVTRLPDLGDIHTGTGTTWRFSVMGDPLVDNYIIRDSDAPILQREVDAVGQWLQLGTDVLLPRDAGHEIPRRLHHGGNVGGCNTWKADEARSVRDYILKSAKRHYEDQTNLNFRLWPRIRSNVTQHDSYLCLRYPGSLPFPSERFNFTFVGARTYRQKHVKDRVYGECPVGCRPKGHEDWLYC